MNASLLFDERTTFRDVVRALDEGGHGVLALLDRTGKLHGIVTDGDIRRSILNNTTDLDRIINTTPEVASDDEPKAKVFSRLKRLVRRHMPIVDEDRVFQGFISLDDKEWNLKPNRVVIMAGGLGSRLLELTKETPKPMLKVGGRPILERIIEQFSQFGFVNFLLSVNYKKEVIQNYFGDGASFGVNIEYIEEYTRMGTAGALSLISDKLQEPLLVANGDVLTNLDCEYLLSWHNAEACDATMCVREFENTIPYGVIEVNESGGIEAIKEKPSQKHYVNAGIYVISPTLLEKVPKNSFYDMPDFFEALKKEGYDIKAHVVDDYWIDVGIKEHFEQANRDFDEGLNAR